MLQNQRCLGFYTELYMHCWISPEALMRITWKIETRDVKRVRELVAEYEMHPIVSERRKRNVERIGLSVTKNAVWKVIVGCLLTTQQKSGPNSRVGKFLRNESELLLFTACARKRKLASFAEAAISQYGLRRAPTIGGEIEANFRWLSDGGWVDFQRHLRKLRSGSSVEIEREAASFVSTNLAGFGPKQSRNMLQWLGLTQHEIPLDSRVLKWLNKSGFPIRLSAQSLADEAYYCFVLDGVQKLCSHAGVLPCIFDAAVFASFETK
jgi:hypothetical protein